MHESGSRARDGEEHVGGAHDGGKALRTVAGNAHEHLRARGFIDGLGQLRAQALGAS